MKFYLSFGYILNNDTRKKYVNIPCEGNNKKEALKSLEGNNFYPIHTIQIYQMEYFSITAYKIRLLEIRTIDKKYKNGTIDMIYSSIEKFIEDDNKFDITDNKTLLHVSIETTTNLYKNFAITYKEFIERFEKFEDILKVEV